MNTTTPEGSRVDWKWEVLDVVKGFAGLFIVAVVAFAIFHFAHRPFPALASIGDTEATWTQNCGVGKVTNIDAPRFKTMSWRKPIGSTVTVGFTDGLAREVTYLGSFKESDFAKYLAANSQGHTWKLKRQDGKEKEWIRDDGVKAVYEKDFLGAWGLTLTVPAEKSVLRRLLGQ